MRGRRQYDWFGHGAARPTGYGIHRRRSKSGEAIPS